MVRRLPPLNALRAFEAAARHLSFTRAADELRVTQSAVSQQVKNLEDFLGVGLFARSRGTLELTREGRAYLATLSEVFDRVDAVTSRFFTTTGRTVLTIGVMATLAIKWLIPRLARFREENPDVQVRVASAGYAADYEQIGIWRGLGKDIDIAFHYSAGPWPGLRSWWLMGSDLFPVCAPGLLEGGNPLRQPADLVRHELLQVNAPPRENDWRLWLEAAGVGGVDLDHAHRFDYSYLAIQAAVDGLGIAVSHRPFVATDMAAGRLVAPFPITMPSPHGYYLVCAEQDVDKPKTAAFREWILKEAAREREAAETGTA